MINNANGLIGTASEADYGRLPDDLTTRRVIKAMRDRAAEHLEKYGTPNDVTALLFAVDQLHWYARHLAATVDLPEVPTLEEQEEMTGREKFQRAVQSAALALRAGNTVKTATVADAFDASEKWAFDVVRTAGREVDRQPGG
ncbi:hypothetical protein HD597_011334 [Nonomuraea thailandensis]|uniref:Uncharacterized protein n=1 Tax=Nonomuraea thailandensis TaxID=1188745 RepID=A0A9X2K969_9ACTN|nr:hypothetical protein [Nonomuraea thailandensis]MCP2364314.1 hypothetical protein [Nonomuraea thailandensis]